MPTILRAGPHRFFFFSNEGKEPPHVHVETAERYAKFWLMPITLAVNVGYSARELRQIRELIEQNAALFLEKWNDYFSSN